MEFSDQHVGEIVRAARERQHITLEVIARSLHVPLKTLRALEERDYASLPADVYARGFLKQYASALGLDPVPLLRQFTTERARFPSRPAAVFPWARELPRRVWTGSLWEWVTPRTLAVAGGVLVALIVVFYVGFQVRTYTRPPRLDVLEPEQDVERPDRTLTVRGRTDPTAELAINGERAVVRDDGTFEETLHLGEGVNTLRFVARSVGGRETTVGRDVLVRLAGGSSPTPGMTSPSPRSGPVSVSVQALGEEVWVSLMVDGSVAFAGLLPPSAERTVEGTRILVTSGKASKTRITVDGESRGVLADTPGVVRDVLFTRNRQTGTVDRQELPAPTPSSPSPKPS